MSWVYTARGRFVLTRVLPAALWLATMVGVIFLWHDVAGKGPILGFAHSVQYKVEATARGRVERLAVDIGQQVRTGQVIATLDPTDVDAEMSILESELLRLDAELDAGRARATERSASAAGRLDRAGEEAARDLREAETRLQIRAAELSTITIQRKELSELLGRGLITKQDLSATDLRFARLSKEVKALQSTIALHRRQLSAARKRRDALPGSAAELSDRSLRAQKKVVERKLWRLRRRREALVLRTTMSGRVSAINKHKGEVLQAGQALATIVSPRSDRVVACVYEKQAMEMRVGRKVTLYPRGWGKKRLSGHVMAVGPIVNQLPARCRPEPRVRAWGRDMFIQLDEPADLVPGLAFNVRLEGKASPVTVGVPKPVKKRNGAPVAVKVPAGLKAISRFEPSGLIWVPRLARYLVVSDDTGTQAKNEHAPWLFTMSNTGVIDKKPLVIKGLKKVNDLESIARGDDGDLYILSSQSYSKKGKRKASRQLFGRLRPEGFSYRLAGSVSLATLLDEADAQTRAALGIRTTDALDIEGMTAMDRGLLVGLKAPLSEQGEALIWQLRHPAELLSTGKLAEAGLSLWGKVPLTVTADRQAAPGGVAELLSMPDGTLLLAATASGGNPQTQDGSLWRVERDDKGQVRSKRLKVFAGLKPEGLCLSATPGRVTVVFDTGAATPRWLDLPWPR